MAITLQQRLQRSHIAIMRSPQFAMLSGVIMLGKSELVNNMPTAATDGRNKMYGKDFMTELDDKTFNFVVLHENFHVLYKHLTTWDKLSKIDASRANMAMDYVINLQIRDLDPEEKVMSVWPNALIDDKYKGWSVREVFNDLEDQDNSGVGKAMDDHDWDSAGELTEAQKEELAAEIDRAVRQGEIAAKRLKGKSPRDIGAIPESRVDWRKALRDFVTSVCAGNDLSTWSRPRRRMMAHNLYMPSSFSESVGEMVVAVDTSGSISDEGVREFLAEVVGVCKAVTPDKVHLLYWGSHVAGVETYEQSQYDTLAVTTRPQDGGGTEPQVIKDWMVAEQVKPAVVLVLSDGYVASWPDFGVPTLWAMTTDNVAPNATTIKITEE